MQSLTIPTERGNREWCIISANNSINQNNYALNLWLTVSKDDTSKHMREGGIKWKVPVNKIAIQESFITNYDNFLFTLK